jgi:hypothetical protein
VNSSTIHSSFAPQDPSHKQLLTTVWIDEIHDSYRVVDSALVPRPTANVAVCDSIDLEGSQALIRQNSSASGDLTDRAYMPGFRIYVRFGLSGWFTIRSLPWPT